MEEKEIFVVEECDEIGGKKKCHMETRKTDGIKSKKQKCRRRDPAEKKQTGRERGGR